MKSIFKHEHVVETSYQDAIYLERFLDTYQIGDVDRKIYPNRIMHRFDLSKREFAAMCEYLNDLGKLGIYPILL